jgi:hypothetical protein
MTDTKINKRLKTFEIKNLVIDDIVTTIKKIDDLSDYQFSLGHLRGIYSAFLTNAQVYEIHTRLKQELTRLEKKGK